MYYFVIFPVLWLISFVVVYKKRKSIVRSVFLSFIHVSIAQGLTFLAVNSFKMPFMMLLQKNFLSRMGFSLKFTALSIVVLIFYFIFLYDRVSVGTAEKAASKRRALFSSVLAFLFVSFALLLVYTDNFFHALNMDALIFTLKMPIAGSSSNVLYSFIIMVLIIPSLAFLVNYVCAKKAIKFVYQVPLLKKDISFFPISIQHPKTVLAVYFILVMSIVTIKLDLIDFVKSAVTENDTFYEENYIDPRNISFTFPEKKKNLIFIYLESMEISAATLANKEHNIIPELTALANTHLSFSHTEGLGGQVQLSGTGFSLASLCCTHLGLPLILPIGGNSYEGTKHFFNGAYGLGDILKDNGYYLSFILGAGSEFGGLKALLKTHGDFDLKDSNYYRNVGKVPKDYFVWWGIEDKKIIEFSKEELSRLAREEKQPFMFSVFLEDTHSLGGYLSDDCEQKFPKQIHNVFSCMSKRVSEFVSWIQSCDFYKDSVIVILGDHLYMGGDLYDKSVKKSDRHAYNVFINSSIEGKHNKNRAFSTFDFFPTIVESLGIRYDADGLGLGRSLFSEKPTLLESYGEKELNAFINQKSNFYRNRLLNKKE